MIGSNVVALVPKAGASETWVVVRRENALAVWSSSHKPMVQGLDGAEYEVRTAERWEERVAVADFSKLRIGVYGK